MRMTNALLPYTPLLLAYDALVSNECICSIQDL
jgi:hypothetical protein